MLISDFGWISFLHTELKKVNVMVPEPGRGSINRLSCHIIPNILDYRERKDRKFA